MYKKIEFSIRELAKGNFILIHDFPDREDEVDLACLAVKCSPKHIYKMRNEGGGAITVALHYKIAEKLNLPLIAEVYFNSKDKFSIFNQVPEDCASPYGDPPSFSISINHIDVYGGVTDNDRSLSIRQLGLLGNYIYRNDRSTNYYQNLFGSQFRTPGHTFLQIAHKDLLRGRRGHTELSVALAFMGGISPVSVLCEMLDKKTGMALTFDEASKYAKKNDMVMVEGNEIMKAYEEYEEEIKVLI